jgi:hypothetical protein
LTKHLSAIWHAILDSFRPITIWSLGLTIHYFVNPYYGEAWVSPGSSLQLVGLVLLLLGTAIYNGSIPIFAEDEYSSLDEEEVALETELAMGAVTLQR